MAQDGVMPRSIASTMDVWAVIGAARLVIVSLAELGLGDNAKYSEIFTATQKLGFLFPPEVRISDLVRNIRESPVPEDDVLYFATDPIYQDSNRSIWVIERTKDGSRIKRYERKKIDTWSKKCKFIFELPLQ